MEMVLNELANFGRTFLRGKLTYVVASVGILGSIAMLLNNQIDNEVFFYLMNANLAILGLRRAIK